MIIKFLVSVAHERFHVNEKSLFNARVIERLNFILPHVRYTLVNLKRWKIRKISQIQSRVSATLKNIYLFI